MQIGFGRIRLILATVALATAGTAVRAERPMSVDDAGTLTRAMPSWSLAGARTTRPGASKARWAMARSITSRWKSPSHAPAMAASPQAPRFGHRGLPSNGFLCKPRPVCPQGSSTSMAMSMRWGFVCSRPILARSGELGFAGGPLLHLNVGREWAREEGSGSAANTWGIGFDLPFTEALHGTVESYGAENSSPDRAVGLRYELRDGLKFSGAIGRGNDRSFANLGVAWEF